VTQAGTYPVDRRAPDNLGRMVWMSLGVHLLCATLLFVLPSDWFVEREPDVMKITIALGGGAEKTAGGQTSAGSRAIQQVAPPPKRPAPILPATPPKAAAAASVVKPSKPYAPPMPDSPPNPRPPTTGAKISPGSSPAETRVIASTADGLSFASGAGGVQALDNNFCCPEWAEELRRRILANWDQNQLESGVTEIVFEVRKDGSFSAPEVVKSSGSTQLDVASRAVFNKERLRLLPLPSKYPGDTLRVRLAFEYKR
jgi:outer membrane biosynthesis protein TonB